MAEKTRVSFRTSTANVAFIDRLAKNTERSRSALLEEALDAYLDLQRYYLEHIEAGMRDLDEGKFIPHEDVVAWLESWGTDHELPPPRPRQRD
jgi:predicted transcriptional regulator